MSRFPALASREFRIFIIGQLVSLIGTWMQMTVQPYLAYRLTGQPWLLGVIAFASALPTLLFTLPAGVYVEHANRRKVVIAMQVIMMVQALVLGVLTLTGLVQVWHIVVLAFILGSANAIEIPARQSMLFEMVGREGLTSAIGLQSTAFNTARVLGPSLSAPFLVLLGEHGEGWAFLANAVSFLFVIAGLMVIRPKFAAKPKARTESALSEMRAGWRFVAGSPLHLLLLLGITVFSLVGFPNMSQVPAFAKDVLAVAGDTDAAVAARNSAMLSFQGLGALVAAITISLAGNFRHKGWLLAAGEFMAGVGLLLLAVSRLVPLTYVAMALFGWGSVTGWATTNTVMQLVTPDEYRTRTISIMMWAGNGLMPVGSLLIGALAQNFGPPLPALIGGIVCMAVPLLINVMTPRVRNVRA